MVNSSKVSFFTLSAYIDVGRLRWLYFFIVMSVYVLLLLSNLLLIVVICLNRTLHEPMYICLCCLFVNDLFGSTALYPMLLFQIPQDIHTITFSFCFLQIFIVYLYGTTECLILCVISYDRYLAICYPLQYSTRVNINKVLLLLTLSWLYSFAIVLIVVLQTVPLDLCGDTIPKVYCTNYAVVKLSCSDTSANIIGGLSFIILTVVGPLTFMMGTYIRILKVCLNGSKQTRQKALSTCGPHLVSFMNFSFGVFFESMSSRFDLRNVPSVIRVILSIYFLVAPPLFNPLIYGLKLTKVRVLCKDLLCSAVSHQ